MKSLLVILITGLSALVSCAQKTPNSISAKKEKETNMSTTPLPATTAVATFANGCFWCTEAIFEELDGVLSAVSGYTGGETINPTYKEVCSGNTGHAECLQITYDTTKISFDELLEVFWQTHDPTTLNCQGADGGTEYRRGIFYHSEEQRAKADPRTFN